MVLNPTLPLSGLRILWTSIKRESVGVMGDFSVFGCRTLNLKRAHVKKQTEESCGGSCHGTPRVPSSVSTPKDFPELLDGAQTANAPQLSAACDSEAADVWST